MSEPLFPPTMLDTLKDLDRQRALPKRAFCHPRNLDKTREALAPYPEIKIVESLLCPVEFVYFTSIDDDDPERALSGDWSAR